MSEISHILVIDPGLFQSLGDLAKLEHIGKSFFREQEVGKRGNQRRETSLQLLRIVVGIKSSCNVFGGMLWIAWRTSSSLMLANRRRLDGELYARSTGEGKEPELVMHFFFSAISAILP